MEHSSWVKHHPKIFPFFILLKPYDVGLIISLICAEEKNEAEWPEVTELVGRPELWLPPKPAYVL